MSKKRCPRPLLGDRNRPRHPERCEYSASFQRPSGKKAGPGSPPTVPTPVTCNGRQYPNSFLLPLFDQCREKLCLLSCVRLTEAKDELALDDLRTRRVACYESAVCLFATASRSGALCNLFAPTNDVPLPVPRPPIRWYSLPRRRVSRRPASICRPGHVQLLGRERSDHDQYPIHYAGGERLKKKSGCQSTNG
jgi:hypothetical protein